jgi:hypothetical protein
MFFQHPGLDIREYYKDFGVHSLIAGESVVERDRFPDLMSRERLMVEGKPFTVKKAWHPGPYGHELVGDVISYTYLAILKDALLEAKSCMQTNMWLKICLKQLKTVKSIFLEILELHASVHLSQNLIKPRILKTL